MAAATVRRPLFWREGRWLAPPPHAPRETSQRTADASAAGVPPGRACRGPPRACESHGAAGDSSAGMASRAGLRQPSSACGRSRAGLRQPGFALLALASAPSAAASRLPTAAPLGHGAAPVCLRHRARPACSGRLPPAPRSASPLRRPRPVAAYMFRALRPASLPPHRLHALRSRVGGADAHGLVWRVGWWGRTWPRPARRPGTAAASPPTPCWTRGPSPRTATRPQRGRPARG